jgi:hypothetical protein
VSAFPALQEKKREDKLYEMLSESRVLNGSRSGS